MKIYLKLKPHEIDKRWHSATGDSEVTGEVLQRLHRLKSLAIFGVVYEISKLKYKVSQNHAYRISIISGHPVSSLHKA